MSTLELPIVGIGCGDKVQRALQKLPGVHDVEVLLRAGGPERFEALTRKGIRAATDRRTVAIGFPANLLTAL